MPMPYYSGMNEKVSVQVMDRALLRRAALSAGVEPDERKGPCALREEGNASDGGAPQAGSRHSA
jgi:hypothetical protein